MKQFISLKQQGNGKRIVVAVDKIVQMYENGEATHILLLTNSNSASDYRPIVKEKIDEILKQIQEK